jgi:flagellar hook assembly protein FlgD
VEDEQTTDIAFNMTSTLPPVSTEEENILPVKNNYNLTNYPNPFNGETTISFSLTTNLHEKARIEIFNIKGQKVKTFDVITNGAAGSVIWNGRDETNKPVSSGIYFYKLVAGENTVTQKMLLLK